jgi:hypothetical protein
MSKQPIMKFKNEEELIKLGKYYQHRLFLDDWIIKFKIATYLEDSYGNICCGLTISNSMIKEATISIDNDYKPRDYELSREPVELTLLHEILHVFYPTQPQSTSTFEGAFYQNTMHAKIESMAKSILMIKYNLDFDWFKNF